MARPVRLPPPAPGTADRLIDAAAALFRRKGYAAATTREVAALLGVQSASLYHHIERKEDLLYAICVRSLERIHRRVETAIAGREDPVERLRAMVEAHLTTSLGHLDQHATMLFELRSLSPSRRAEVVRLRDAYERLVRDLIAEGQRAGVVRRDLSPKVLGLALLNLLNWTIFWYRPGGELTPRRLAAHLATIYLEGALLHEGPFPSAPPEPAAAGTTGPG